MTPMFLRVCSVAAGLAVSMAAFAHDGTATGAATASNTDNHSGSPGRSNGHRGGLHPE
jgi:hypothetical protein